MECKSKLGGSKYHIIILKGFKSHCSDTKIMKTSKNKLYKIVYKGVLYTGYNRQALLDYIVGLKLKSYTK